MIHREAALAMVRQRGDDWQSWRALRMLGDVSGEIPDIPTQDGVGGFLGPSTRSSPGATGEMLCLLKILGLEASGPATIAADWLEEVRTPAGAWLDAPDDVPGGAEEAAAGRVWASASATAGLLIMERDPGDRVITLLRGEAEAEGRFTGGNYTTVAAAAAFWLAEGAQTEIAEWALRWARESHVEGWGPWELVTALVFWGASGIPPDHPSIEEFTDGLVEAAPADGWTDDPELTLRALEVAEFLGA